MHHAVTINLQWYPLFARIDTSHINTHKKSSLVVSSTRLRVVLIYTV